MKKSIIGMTTCGLLTISVLTGCNTPAEKVEHAKSDVRAAEKELKEAEMDYKADMEAFRAETAKEIAANDKAILDYKARVEFEKREAKTKYKKTLNELEIKNKEMKDRMDNYTDDGKDNWENFKTDFRREMDSISVKFKTVILKPII